MPKIEEVMSSPSASYWLRNALKEAVTRDPVDAVNDAEFLAELLESRLDAIMGGVR